MSRTEVNKGKLVPVSTLDIKREVGPLVEDADSDGFHNNFYEFFGENCHEYGYALVKGKFYKVRWEVEAEDPDEGYALVDVNTDGSINFHTCHYNGGGDWTEVVESMLE